MAQPAPPEDPQGQPAHQRIPEMVGATSEPFFMGPGETRVTFRLHAPAGPAHDRQGTGRAVFLRIENVTCEKTAPTFSAFVNVPPGAKTADHPELFGGSMGMFGLPMASDPRSEHGGTGMNFTLDISELFDRLRLRADWNPHQLEVTFVPSFWSAPVPQVRVGRVSLYLQ